MPLVRCALACLVAALVAAPSSAFLSSPAHQVLPRHPRTPARAQGSYGSATVGRGGLLGARCSTDAATWDKSAWKSGFRSAEEDEAYQVTADMIEGTLPSDFVGTLYRNGPGMFEFGENKVQYQDADGFVTAFTFPGDGSCTFRGRFVRTEGHTREQRALSRGYTGEAVYSSRGGRGTVLGQAVGLQQLENVKNAANGGVVHWGGRLLALDEAFLPHELDPAGLYTVGESRIRESLPKRGPLGCYPKYDPAEDRLIGQSCKTLPGLAGADTRLRLYEWDDSWKLVSDRLDKFDSWRRFRDFGFTRTHYVLFEAPLEVNWLAYAAGGRSVRDCMTHDLSKPTKIHLLPRGGGEGVVVEGEGDFVERIVNAYNDKEGNVVVDTICASALPGPNKDEEDAHPSKRLVRWKASLSGSSWASRQVLSDKQLDSGCVNPFVHSVQHGHMYLALGAGGGGESAPSQGILKLSLDGMTEDVWSPEPSQFCGAPVFVPRIEGSSEDDGYIATLVHDGKAQRSFLALLDATRLSAGPVCKLNLKQAIPHDAQGSWAEGVVPCQKDFEEGRRRALWSDKGWDEFGGGLSLL